MRTLPAGMATRIANRDFTGENKATTRVTIQKIRLGIYRTGDQVFSSPIFPTVASSAKELPNLKSMSWQRSIDTDTASMSMELFNTVPLVPGTLPATGDVFDGLGYYTYNRGRSSYAQNWGHQPNEWQNMLVPDRLVRTYQGYGADYSVAPEEDPNLVLTGIWLIDDVTYGADGVISVECRDLARLLTDQIAFPPVVPLPQYPLKFERLRTVPDAPTPKATTVWRRPTLRGSSNGTAATQFGHHPVDAFDGSSNTSYWLSTGFDVPANPSSFVWIEGKSNGDVLSAARVSVRGGPYRVYLSVYTDKAAGGKKTGWNGVVKIPYKKASTLPDNGSGITYSKTGIAKANSTLTLTFPPVKGITRVRFTFTNLYNSKHSPKPYRAAVRDIQVAVGKIEMVSQGTHLEGNYDDYTNLVKLLLAYGGFFWPQNGTQFLTDGNTEVYSFPPGTHEPFFGDVSKTGKIPKVDGRVWGDLKMSGQAGPSPLGIEVWDKKPLMDGVNYVRDILGYLFYVDETGGAIFRPPNIYKLGNYLVPTNGIGTTRTTSFLTITDDEAILGLRSKLSSRSLRERVFVADKSGKIGALAKSRIPDEIASDLRRVSGWTDQNFGTASGVDTISEAEATERAQVMADLITLRQLFTFRTNSLRIPANPAIQVDDQVRLEERVTGEGYFHWVRSISSQWDAESGQWIYDLTTSWLGTDPAAEWAFTTKDLSAETKAYLAALGQI